MQLQNENHIRPTTPEDIEPLVSLTEATGMFKPLEIQALREVLDDYFDSNQENGHRCVTAEEQGEIVGFTYFAPTAMTEGSWHLWWIVVRKETQGSGVGKRLLRHFEDEVARNSGRRIFVETGSLPHYDPTRQFYLKTGYEQHAILKDYYAAGDSMIVFRKEIM